MRKLIVWNLMTLDGFFEGANSWELDWHEYVWGEELEQLSIAQLESADALVFGRATYEGMASYWSSATGEVAERMNAIPKIVFSRTLDQADWNNTRLVGEHPVEEVAKLKENGQGKDVFIFGSADLCGTLMEHGLIDEYRIGLVPVVLGTGTPLFKPAPDRLRMNLVEARPLKTGCVVLRYQPVPTKRTGSA